MNRNIFIYLSIILMTFNCALHVKKTEQTAELKHQSLNEQLEFFRPFLGNTYVGVNNQNDRQITDVSRFERALNGQAIRNLHSLNNGEYGGETLIFWSEDEQSLVYYYFTTAGFFTTPPLGQVLYSTGLSGAVPQCRARDYHLQRLLYLFEFRVLLPMDYKDGEYHHESLLMRNSQP